MGDAAASCFRWRSAQGLQMHAYALGEARAASRLEAAGKLASESRLRKYYRC